MADEPLFEESDLEQVKSLEPPAGSSCLVCFEDLSRENAVGYKPSKHAGWSLSTFCVDCVKHLLKIQYHKYLDTLATTTCAKEQRTLLDRGPPVNVSDRLGFPEAESAEVYSLYDFGSAEPLSPRLEGSLVSPRPTTLRPGRRDSTCGRS